LSVPKQASEKKRRKQPFEELREGDIPIKTLREKGGREMSSRLQARFKGKNIARKSCPGRGWRRKRLIGIFAGEKNRMFNAGKTPAKGEGGSA